jgi:hypothetical protein
LAKSDVPILLVMVATSTWSLTPTICEVMVPVPEQ